MMHIIPRPIINTASGTLRGASAAQDRASAMLLELTAGN
jgi:hypothetical protein